jgi:hypothetical protein
LGSKCALFERKQLKARLGFAFFSFSTMGLLLHQILPIHCPLKFRAGPR